MPAKGVLIHEDSIDGIRKAVDMAANHINSGPQKSTKRIIELPRTCKLEFRLILFGSPDAGHITIPMGIPDADNNNALIWEVITIDHDDGTDEVEAAIATHSTVSVEQIEARSPGGNLPGQEISFSFKKGIKTSLVQFKDYTNQLQGQAYPYALLRVGRG